MSKEAIKLTRREFLKITGATIVVGTFSAACQGVEALFQTPTVEKPTPTPSPTPTEFPPTPTKTPTKVPTETPTLTPSPTEAASPTPTLTVTPTETATPIPTETPTPTLTPEPTPTFTSTPEPTPTKEIIQAPQIEGLKIIEEGGKIIYQTEAEVYAGEVIQYKFNGEVARGIVLVPEVVKNLMEKANTPEAIEKGEWKIPFPLDAREEKKLEIHPFDPGNYGKIFFSLKGLSPEAEFVSPFIQEVELDVVNAPAFGPSILLQLSGPFRTGENHYLAIAHPSESSLCNEGLVFFAKAIVWKIKGVLPGSQAPLGAQIVIALARGKGSERADFNVTDNILEIEDHMVFLAAK